MPTYLQVTIRELMALVLFAALAFAGLSTGGTLASIVMAAAVVGKTAPAIIASLDAISYDRLQSASLLL